MKYENLVESIEQETTPGAKAWEPDYTFSILKQMAADKEFRRPSYIRFIHEPKLLVNPIRDLILFDNPILETLTKSTWFMVPLGWLPCVFYYLYQSTFSLANHEIFFLFISATLLWSFFEYMLHRFVFHGEHLWLPDYKPIMILHFLVHGIHHAFPQDRYRLVFPVVPGLFLLNLMFQLIFRAVFPE